MTQRWLLEYDIESGCWSSKSVIGVRCVKVVVKVGSWSGNGNCQRWLMGEPIGEKGELVVS